jgi:hypothetical protein
MKPVPMIAVLIGFIWRPECKVRLASYDALKGRGSVAPKAPLKMRALAPEVAASIDLSEPDYSINF